MRNATGEAMNSLARMVAAATFSGGGASTTFTEGYLYDGEPDQYAEFAAAETDGTITVDLNMVANGDCEDDTAGELDEWTESVSGATSDVLQGTAAGEFNNGAGGMELVVDAGGGYAKGHQDFTVRANEYLNLCASLKGDGTQLAKLQVQDLRTKQYLTVASAWQAGATDVWTRDTNTWADQTAIEFQVPEWDDLRAHTTTLRVTGYADEANAHVYLDDIYMWPSTTLCSIHGHDVPPSITALELRRSTDNFSGSDDLEATLTVKDLAFAEVFGTRRTNRYWRLKFVGTPNEAQHIGEWVLTQHRTLSSYPLWGYSEAFSEAQIRAEGGVFVAAIEDSPTRAYELVLDHANDSNYEEAVQVLYRASRGGHYPAVVIPVDDEAAVVFCRIGGSISASRSGVVTRSGQRISLTEMPLPTRIA